MVINVIDEEVHFLPQVLSSVEKIASQIVLVDMTRNDNVGSIAKKFRFAEVYKHKWVSYVEPARNFGISKANSEWILILDPDEELSESLSKKIINLIKDHEISYYRIPRKNIVFKKWLQHSRWWPDYNIRLFRKGYVEWGDEIHSVPITQGRGADLEAVEKYSIIHHHYDSLEQFVDRLNRYTSIQAQNKIESGYIFVWQDVLVKPFNEFLSRYFAGEGYRDGLHGLALSLLQSFSELVLYLKIWQVSGFEKKNISFSEASSVVSKTSRDFNYWKADVRVKHGGGILQRIKRKYKLS